MTRRRSTISWSLKQHTFSNHYHRSQLFTLQLLGLDWQQQLQALKTSVAAVSGAACSQPSPAIIPEDCHKTTPIPINPLYSALHNQVSHWHIKTMRG